MSKRVDVWVFLQGEARAFRDAERPGNVNVDQRTLAEPPAIFGQARIGRPAGFNAHTATFEHAPGK